MAPPYTPGSQATRLRSALTVPSSPYSSVMAMSPVASKPTPVAISPVLLVIETSRRGPRSPSVRSLTSPTSKSS